MTRTPSGGPDGIVVVAKPPGMTSHDVVARARRLLGTRKVGHAGTLDPMATGVLVLGVGRATRLLHHLTADRKEYRAVVRLGWASSTDDAEGEPLVPTGLQQRHAALQHLDRQRIGRAAAALTGDIEQVPPAVSAIKVAGRRSYARARAGEEVRLPARSVRVTRLEVTEVGPVREGTSHSPAGYPYRDVHVDVACSAGTYVRSLARDLGAALGVDGHLAVLERTRSGVFTLAEARTLEQLAEDPAVTPVAEVLQRVFPVRRVSAVETDRLAHGGRITATGREGLHAAIGPDHQAVALITDVDGSSRPVLVFAAG